MRTTCLARPYFKFHFNLRHSPRTPSLPPPVPLNVHRLPATSSTLLGHPARRPRRSARPSEAARQVAALPAHSHQICTISVCHRVHQQRKCRAISSRQNGADGVLPSSHHCPRTRPQHSSASNRHIDLSLLSTFFSLPLLPSLHSRASVQHCSHQSQRLPFTRSFLASSGRLFLCNTCVNSSTCKFRQPRLRLFLLPLLGL